MSRKHGLLVVQILSFLLVSLLGVATGYLAHDATGFPPGFRLLQRSALPLAGVTLLLIIGLVVWQHVAEERLSSLTRPAWVSDRSPFPGLEAFTEQDAAVFFGREVEIAELLERLHPVVAALANRMITVVGPSGVAKSSLVQAGVVSRLRQRRGGWIVVPPILPGDHPLHGLARSLAAAGTAARGTGRRRRARRSGQARYWWCSRGHARGARFYSINTFCSLHKRPRFCGFVGMAGVRTRHDGEGLPGRRRVSEGAGVPQRAARSAAACLVVA